MFINWKLQTRERGIYSEARILPSKVNGIVFLIGREDVRSNNCDKGNNDVGETAGLDPQYSNKRRIQQRRRKKEQPLK